MKSMAFGSVLLVRDPTDSPSGKFYFSSLSFVLFCLAVACLPRSLVDDDVALLLVVVDND
jgi:hypothetical protein